jgi:hypothetical protein
VLSVILFNFLHSVFQECDATIVTTSYAYESVSLDAMKEWFFDMQKDVHVFGPLLPSGYGTEIQDGEEGLSVAIKVFLEEMLVQHGKRSVFFVKSFSFFLIVPTNFSQISFGTLYWTTVLEYLDELIDVLIEKKAPFVRDRLPLIQ